MSRTEINKGKLIPLEDQELEFLLVKNGLSKEDFLNDHYEYGVEKFNGQYYRVEWEIEGDEAHFYCDVKENSDGSIEFFTIHHNGGAHWIEVVEDDLNERFKERD